MRTGQPAWAKTSEPTLPRTMALSGPRPRLPITTRSGIAHWISSRIASLTGTDRSAHVGGHLETGLPDLVGDLLDQLSGELARSRTATLRRRQG